MKFDIEDPKFREVIKEIVKSQIQKVAKDQEKNGLLDIGAVKQLENIESTIKKYESANRFAKFFGVGSSQTAKKSFEGDFKQAFESVLIKGGYKVNNGEVEEVYNNKFTVRTHEYVSANPNPQIDIYAVPDPRYSSVNLVSRSSDIEKQPYTAGAVPQTSHYDATLAPHQSDKPAFQARSNNIQYTALSTTNSDNVYGELGLTPTGPSVSPITPPAQLSLRDVVLNQFGTPKGGIYGDTSGLSAADAEANKRAYEAEIDKQSPQRAASTQPQAPAHTSATSGLANSAPPKIHQTPVSPDIRATYQPFVSESNQPYAGASSVQPQPPAPAPAKRQLPTPPATNVESSKVSSDIAAKQAALFGGGRPVVGTGVATGRLAAAPNKGSGLQK
jgi:hypothetical protein